MFKIYDRRTSFYQWDLNQKLVVDSNTIKEVHFCNGTEECSLVCEVYDLEGLRVVDVPNVLLQSARRIYVYGYCENYTKVNADFAVVARTKPSDYIYTEVEVKTFAALEKRMEQVEQNGVPQEVLEAAINDYFVEHPFESGATEEEAAQIQANTKDIVDAKADIKDLSLDIEVLKEDILNLDNVGAINYELIEEITLVEDVANVEYTMPKNYKEVLVCTHCFANGDTTCDLKIKNKKNDKTIANIANGLPKKGIGFRDGLFFQKNIDNSIYISGVNEGNNTQISDNHSAFKISYKSDGYNNITKKDFILNFIASKAEVGFLAGSIIKLWGVAE